MLIKYKGKLYEEVANQSNVSFDDIDRELQKTAKNFVNNNKIK